MLLQFRTVRDFLEFVDFYMQSFVCGCGLINSTGELIEALFCPNCTGERIYRIDDTWRIVNEVMK